jgi:hypothetical protein
MTSTVAHPRLIVGTDAYFATQGSQAPHDFSNYDPVPQKFMPIKVNTDNERDGYYQSLQQKMMDFGWRLNVDKNDNPYFTHPTYDGNTFSVYNYELSNGQEIMLPLVERADDPKGLGCTVVQTSGTGHFQVETNEWESYWDSRSGKRKANQLTYQDKRQKKRDEYIEMAKTDPSVKVWSKDTPRCDPITWKYNNPSPQNFEY